MQIFIIGSGNVATHMSRALKKTDSKICGVMSTNTKTGKTLARSAKTTYYRNLAEIPTNHDLYLICVPDDVVAQVASTLPNAIQQNCIVAHTSGSRELADLATCQHSAIFYPLQTFTVTRRMRYDNIPFCITSSTPHITTQLMHLANQISAQVVEMDDHQRKTLHISAVMINNFVNHLIYKSELLLSQQEIPPSLLQPLLMETIEKQRKIGSYAAQTGPARRNDTDTINQHLERINEEDKELYSVLSESITKTYHKDNK